MGGGTTFSASPAIIKPKTYYYIAKGSAPWYSNNWDNKSYVVNIDKSVSGQATVTCDSNVTSMDEMFYYCTSLTSIDLSNFDTSKITDMYGLFTGCSSLTSLDLSSFNTSKVTDMASLAFDCHKLTSIDLSNFDTSKVINMNSMFQNCYYLTTIKGIIDMKSCKWYDKMFGNCTKLFGVKIKNPPSRFNGAGLSSSQYTIVS